MNPEAAGPAARAKPNAGRGLLIRRLAVTAILVFIGHYVGFVVTSVLGKLTSSTSFAFLAEDIPMPHHVPQYKGGLSFRFAMAHDVIHERFTKHGHDYYTRRNELTRRELDSLEPDDPARWPLIDDLAAGLDRTGAPRAAVPLMRDKLAEQKRQGIAGRELYTSFANLGTFLIHANFKNAAASDTEAIERFREGVDLIHESVKVNPEAHFGRERWQAIVAEFLLSSFETPKLLTKFDCLGNRLDEGFGSTPPEAGEPDPLGYRRPHTRDFRQQVVENDLGDPEAFYRNAVDPADPAHWHQLSYIRAGITHVGANYWEMNYSGEGGPTQVWPGLSVPGHAVAAAFDEPMLGIIGMWREGGGANPHFALAIGETMLRVGQHRIAWTAFARAKMLAERFSPDPELQEFLTTHCSTRQKDLIRVIGENEASAIRTTFHEELSFGKSYRSDYHAYEREQLAAGMEPGTENFYDQFHKTREPITSRTGVEETYRVVSQEKRERFSRQRADAIGWLVAGCFALLPMLPWLVRKVFIAPKAG